MRGVLRGVIAVPAAAFALVAYVYLTLPDVRALRTTNPSTTAFMELRDDEARATGRAPRRMQRWVAYTHISPNLKRAVLVAEDDLFWRHEGIDFEQLQESLEATITRKMGYLLSRTAFTDFKKRVDYSEYGGAPLLGVKGVCIICHGRSNANAMKNAIRVAAEFSSENINGRIEDELQGVVV